MSSIRNTPAFWRTPACRQISACRRLTALALASAIGSASASAQTIANPDLFAKSLSAATQATQRYGHLDDEAQLDRVNRIGYQLAQRSEFVKYPFTFSIVDMPIPNAFALPAGQIFVTRGMLNLGLDDDMLAALLGHEIAHVTEEHFLKIRKKATWLTLLSQLATLGAAVAASNSNDYYQGPGGYYYRDNDSIALLQAAQASTAAITELLLRSYSRESEDQSDQEGQRLAALAGFDPDGARLLMTKMKTMIPQSKTFGYWQTHPFFEERILAARARGTGMKAQTPAAETDLEAFRESTQSVLLDFAQSRRKLPQVAIDELKRAALVAWPQGGPADRLRLENLHRIRDQEQERLALSRDYGELIERYRIQMRQVTELTPESSLLPKLTHEVGDMRSKLEELYPQALDVLNGGVFETPFLEAFLSNYPDSERASHAALQLGTAHSRLGNETEAVEQFLKVWESPNAGALSEDAQRGLRNLAPLLRQLGALEYLATQDRDHQLSELAAERLDNFAAKFDDISNGADYLRRFPEGRYAATVTHRVHYLADSLYREMVLYQQLGDAGKAIERANRILEHAPSSPAAERLGRQLEQQNLKG